MKKFILLLIGFVASISVNAGVWCTADEVLEVDTAGNGSGSCWFSAKINGRTISDISICNQTNEQANSRNISIALAAFTANKKLKLWTSDATVSSCDDIPDRWFSGVTRLRITN